MTDEGLEEERGRDNDWAEEEKADHIACATEKPGRSSIAEEPYEGLVFVGEAEAAPLTIEREECVIFRVNNLQENVEVNVTQNRLS